MKTGYVVADIMTTKPVTVSKDTSLKECALLMKQHGVSSMLVKERDELFGIVTGKDYLYKAVAEGLDLNAPITSIMSPVKYVVAPTLDILDAVQLMNKHGIRHLPVMDDKKMVGYITMPALLKIEPQLFELLTDKIELRGIGPDSSLLESLDDEFSGQCESCGNYSSRLVESEAGLICPNCIKD